MSFISGGKRSYSEIDLHDPVVSIITVCLNAEKHIIECIDSVMKYGNSICEHIVIDGGSTDNTIDILQLYDNHIDFWLSEKDNGIYNAMNKSLKYAKGKWILFLGSDDRLHDRFQEILPHLKDPDTIYYGDYMSGAKKYGGKFNSYRLAKSNFCQQSVLYSSKVFLKYAFNEKYRISADHLLNIQCWKDTNFNFFYCPIPLTVFGTSGVSSTQIDLLLQKDLDKIIIEYFGIFIFFRVAIKKIKKSFYRLLGKNLIF